MIFEFLNTQIFYQIFGADNSGPPIVFLHGWGGSTKSFEFFAKQLCQNHKCILIDFPPFGNSSLPAHPWTVETYANSVERLLQSLHTKKIFVVAHSFGGRVAIELALSKKIGVCKMLLTSSAGIRKKSFKRTLKIWQFKALKFFAKIGVVNSKKLERMGSADYQNLPDNMKKTFVNVVNFDQTKKLKNISCPTLLFWGKSDRDTPFCFTKIFKKHIKDCEVIAVDGTHFAYLEHTALFLNVLRAFFEA